MNILVFWPKGWEGQELLAQLEIRTSTGFPTCRMTVFEVDIDLGKAAESLPMIETFDVYFFLCPGNRLSWSPTLRRFVQMIRMRMGEKPAAFVTSSYAGMLRSMEPERREWTRIGISAVLLGAEQAVNWLKPHVG